MGPNRDKPDHESSLFVSPRRRCTPTPEDVLDRSDDFDDALSDPTASTVSPLVTQDSADCGDVTHSVEVTTLLSRLPSLGRDTEETHACGQAQTAKPATGGAGVGGCAAAASHTDNGSTSSGSSRAAGMKRSEARDALMVNPAEGFTSKHPSSDIAYGGVPSAGALARRPGQASVSTMIADRQTGPSTGAAVNPYRVEEAGRRRVNVHTAHGARAAPGVADNRRESGRDFFFGNGGWSRGVPAFHSRCKHVSGATVK